MDNQFAVVCWYNCYSMSTVSLPDGRTWGDIESWYVKFNTFHYVFKGETKWREIDLGDVSIANVYLQRPTDVEIERVGEDGYSTGESLLTGELS